MTSNNITPIYNQIQKALDEHRISMALCQLRAMAMSIKAPWGIMQQIDNLEESFGYLQKYAINGINDPHRESVVDDIASGIRHIASTILRHSNIEESPHQYFSTIRYESRQNDSNLAELLSRYRSINSKINLSILGGQNHPEDENKRDLVKSQELLADRIFNLIWIKYPLTYDDTIILDNIFVDETLPDYFKELIISAVFLGALEYFDELRMVTLAKIYINGSTRIEIKALCALILTMWVHRKNIYGRKFNDIFSSLVELPKWKSDLKVTFLELIRTHDTERISRKLNDEVIPQMMKMRLDLNKKISDVESFEEIIDENPEWEELFEKSGLTDKLKEINDIQIEGGDVMMSTFAQLKYYPFFNNISNWFLPFNLGNSSIKNIFGDTPSDIGEIINSTPMICDSDKYSLLLSFERIPTSERRKMLDQFKLSNINLAELHNSELNPELNSRRNILNRIYIVFLNSIDEKWNSQIRSQHQSI